MSKEMLSREEFIKELTEKQQALGTFLNVLQDVKKNNLLDGTSIKSLISSIANLLFGSIQQNNLEQIHRFLNGEVGGSLLSLIQQVSVPLSESLEGLKNKKLSFLASHKVSANQSLIELLSLSFEKDIQIVTKSGRTGKTHNPATLFPKNLKTALKLYTPIEKVEDQVDNNTLITKETNDKKEEKNGESILSEDAQLSSKEDIISQKIELFLKNSDDLTEFCKAEYQSEYEVQEGYTLSLFDRPPEEDYVARMKNDIKDNITELMFMPIQELYDDPEYDTETIKKVIKKLYDLTKHSGVQAEGNTINILSLLKFVASFDFTAYKNSHLSFIDIFTQNTVASDNKNISSLKQSLTIEKINMLRDIFKKNLQKMLSKTIYTSIVKSVEIKEVILPAASGEKIKINIFVNKVDTARKFDSDFARYLVYVFAKYLHVSIQDIGKVIDINYRHGNAPVGSKTLFDDYVDNTEYLDVTPVQPHSGNKAAIGLMKERVDTQLGFGDVKHVALVGNESTGRTTLAKRSIAKVLEYLPCLRVKEITGASFRKSWSDLWKNYNSNNTKNDVDFFKKMTERFDATYNVDILIIHDIEALVNATEKTQIKMSDFLKQTHMKCIFISQNPIGQFVEKLHPTLRKSIVDLGLQFQRLSQPSVAARKSIFKGLCRNVGIIISEELISLAAVCVPSTESYPVLIKTIKRSMEKDNTPLDKGKLMQILRDTTSVLNPSYTLIDLDMRLNEYIRESDLYKDLAPTAETKMKNKLIAYFARLFPRGGSYNQPIYFTVSELSSYLDVTEATINTYISDVRKTYYGQIENIKPFITQKLNTRLYSSDLFKDTESTA